MSTRNVQNSTTAAPDRHRRTAPSMSDIPAIPDHPVIQTARFLSRPDVFLERGWHRYGDMFRARILGFGTGRHVVLSHPRHVEQIYKSSPQALRLGEIAKKPVIPIAGPNSLLALDQPEHLRHRKLLLPPFHGQRMLAYADIVGEATRRSIAGWPIGTPFALRPHMAEITLEVIMRAVFGLDPGPRYRELHDQLLRMIDASLPLTLALVFPVLRRDFGPVRAWSTMQRAKARVDAMLYEEIADRRRPGATEGRADILSMLVDARDADGDALTDEEIHDELVTMLLAGHETTASALGWAFDLLLHHPRALERLREELHAGDDRYLDAVVTETLRVRPVVATSQRVLTEAQEFDGIRIDAGVTVLCSIWAIHRRPEIYDDPVAFQPERFLDGRPPTYEWVPFGGGVRRCIGANFAPMEMREVIRHVILAAELSAADPELEKPYNRVVLMAPRNGTVAVCHGGGPR